MLIQRTAGNIILHYVTLYYIMLHYITLYYIMLHYITLYYIMLHYITLCYIILHYITHPVVSFFKYRKYIQGVTKLLNFTHLVIQLKSLISFGVDSTLLKTPTLWCRQYIVKDTYPFINLSAKHQCTLKYFYGKWDNIKTVRGKALFYSDTKIQGTKVYSALLPCDAYGIVR
jgi:hypothetical protein